MQRLSACLCPPACSEVTNTFNLLFEFDLRRDASGSYIPPKRILPGTGGCSGPALLHMPCAAACRPALDATSCGLGSPVFHSAVRPWLPPVLQSSKHWRWRSCLGPTASRRTIQQLAAAVAAQSRAAVWGGAGQQAAPPLGALASGLTCTGLTIHRQTRFNKYCAKEQVESKAVSQNDASCPRSDATVPL